MSLFLVPHGPKIAAVLPSIMSVFHEKKKMAEGQKGPYELSLFLFTQKTKAFLKATPSKLPLIISLGHVAKFRTPLLVLTAALSLPPVSFSSSVTR